MWIKEKDKDVWYNLDKALFLELFDDEEEGRAINIGFLEDEQLVTEQVDVDDETFLLVKAWLKVKQEALKSLLDFKEARS